MRLADILACYTRDDHGRARRAVFTEAADSVRPKLAGIFPATEIVVDPPDGSAVVVASASAVDTDEVVTELVKQLSPVDVGVLLVRDRADELPVSALLTRLTEGQLRVIQVAEVSDRDARIAVIMTGDHELPYRIGAMDAPVPPAIAADRLANEWLLEGAVLRTRLVHAEAALNVAAQQTRQLTAQLDQRQRELTAAQEKATALDNAVAELRDQMATAQVAATVRRQQLEAQLHRALHPPSRSEILRRRTAKAWLMIRADPLRGPAKVMHAALTGRRTTRRSRKGDR